MFKKKYIPYLITVLILLGIKLWFAWADNSSVKILIAPVNRIVGMATGRGSIFITESGYYFKSLNIIINKSCSGINLFLISFSMLSVLFLGKKSLGQKRVWIIPGTLVFSYIFTIIVNSVRIIFSLTISGNSHINSMNLPWLHQAEGLFIYLFFLIGIYIICNKLFTGEKHG